MLYVLKYMVDGAGPIAVAPMLVMGMKATGACTLSPVKFFGATPTTVYWSGPM